jgi:peroxiredoxin (alkyl hydroperoxide reductase subunit C)
MAWTFVCPTEIIAFSDRAADFAARGASVVFASTDSEYSLLAWTNASRKDGGLGPIKIPLFSDKNHQLSKDYGVLIEEEGVALRGLFVIDPSGIVRQVRTRTGWETGREDGISGTGLYNGVARRWK